MTFEEAWPHIKDGKEFRYLVPGESEWTQWYTLKQLFSFDLKVVADIQFQIKSEPRELKVIFFENGSMSIWRQDENAPKDAIKFREVIE